nr:MAG TPA: hypothetical protein [Bacteriophage sp.]
MSSDFDLFLKINLKYFWKVFVWLTVAIFRNTRIIIC